MKTEIEVEHPRSSEEYSSSDWFLVRFPEGSDICTSQQTLRNE